MGILRLGDGAGNHDEEGRGPNMSRRGALKLSAGSIATFAVTTAAGTFSFTGASLFSPETALGQIPPCGGNLSKIPACTIRVSRALPIRDAESSLDSPFYFTDYNAKKYEDNMSWPQVTGSTPGDNYSSNSNLRGGLGYDSERNGWWYFCSGNLTRTINLTRNYWSTGSLSGTTGFVLVWRSAACDAVGDACDVWMYVHDFNCFIREAGWYNPLQNYMNGGPVFSTFYYWVNGTNEKFFIPSFESLAGCDVRATVDIKFFKSSAHVPCLKSATGALAEGTFLCFCDDLDSVPNENGVSGTTFGNRGTAEYFGVNQGADAYYIREDNTLRIYDEGGTRWFEATKRRQATDFQTLVNGFAVATSPQKSGMLQLRNGANCHRSQFFDQRFYPLTLRAFPMVKRDSDKWPIAPGYYMFKSSVLGKDNVHMWDHGYADGSQYQWGSGSYDHNSIFMVTPYYAGGDRGDKKGYEDGYRISSLRSGLSHMDYWGFADCSSAAAHNYVNNSVNQRISIDDAGDGFYYVRCGDQYLSGYPGRPEDYLGWCKKSAAERDIKWDIEPWCHVADWAPENLYCKYDVCWGGGVYGTFTTDANGYAAQIDTSRYGHNLAPSNGYDPYDMKLEYASWTNTRPADNAIQNSKTFGHLQYLFVQSSPWPCNYVRSAVPMNRGHLRLNKTVRKKSAGEVIPNGYYFIHSAGDEGYCLDVQWGGTANGTPVQLYQENRTLGQLWVVKNFGNGEIRIAPACNMCERLDALGGNNQDAQLNIWYNNGAANQKWMPVKSVNGGYALKAADTNLAIDVKDGQFANGSKVRLWAANGTVAQSWVFEPLDASADNNTLDESGLPDDPLSANTNWQYKLYADEKLQNEVATFDYDSAGSGNAMPLDADGNEYLPYIGRPLWLRETVAGDGCQLDERTYKLTIPCAVGEEKFQVMSGVFWLDMVDLPDGAVTVHFVCLDKDDKATEVSSYQVPCGADVSTSDEGFTAADALLAGFYGVEDTSFVLRWFEGTKDEKPEGNVFNDPSKSFSGKSRAGEDVWLYAQCLTATVTFYCDGTDEDHVVMVDESVLQIASAEGVAAGGRMRPASLRRAAGKKVKARFTRMYLGTRFSIPYGISEAAALPGCTPGWDGWYTDKDDLAVTSDTPGQGGESKLVSSEFTLTKPLTNLYSVNRATLSHGYAAGSLTPDLDEVQTGADGRKVFRKRPDLSSADALGTISLPSDRVARLGVKSLPRLGRVYAWCEGNKWRALSPAAWYADESAEGAEMSSVDLERDTRVYVKWQWDVADGIVDKRD